jgi:SulP family sulfate permease
LIDEDLVPLEIPAEPVETILPLDLWDELHQRTPPVIVDVREPREYQQAHILQAASIPLLKLITDPSQLPQIRPVVLVCRSGRRSTRASFMLRRKSYTNIRVLEGGMIAWENAGLLEAVGVDKEKTHD